VAPALEHYELLRAEDVEGRGGSRCDGDHFTRAFESLHVLHLAPVTLKFIVKSIFGEDSARPSQSLFLREGTARQRAFRHAEM